MSILSAPKNLTRNVLIGMGLGVLIAAIFHYQQAAIPAMLFDFVEKYVFNLGGQIFKNFTYVGGSAISFLLISIGDFIAFKHGETRFNCN